MQNTVDEIVDAVDDGIVDDKLKKALKVVNGDWTLFNHDADVVSVMNDYYQGNGYWMYDRPEVEESYMKFKKNLGGNENVKDLMAQDLYKTSFDDIPNAYDKNCILFTIMKGRYQFDVHNGVSKNIEVDSNNAKDIVISGVGPCMYDSETGLAYMPIGNPMTSKTYNIFKLDNNSSKQIARGLYTVDSVGIENYKSNVSLPTDKASDKASSQTAMKRLKKNQRVIWNSGDDIEQITFSNAINDLLRKR